MKQVRFKEIEDTEGKREGIHRIGYSEEMNTVTVDGVVSVADPNHRPKLEKVAAITTGDETTHPSEREDVLYVEVGQYVPEDLEGTPAVQVVGEYAYFLEVELQGSVEKVMVDHQGGSDMVKEVE